MTIWFWLVEREILILCKVEIVYQAANLKVVSTTFLLVCLSKREHLSNKGKCFLFHFKSSFRS